MWRALDTIGILAAVALGATTVVAQGTAGASAPRDIETASPGEAPEPAPPADAPGSRAGVARATRTMAAGSEATEGTSVEVGSITARMDAAAAGPPEPEPVAISAASVSLEAAVVPVGLNNDGSVEIPPDVDVTGWYRYGGRPGERGPTVVVGHVDAVGQGAGAFSLLVYLEVGTEVAVTMSDGRVHRFVVDARRSYDKHALPVATLFGTGSGLRLVTCGGDFDPATGSYSSNVVVYAHELTPFEA